uniref:Uncharacterized protein n=1 Tax=Panthera tigris altaica TaxID=74533 RepID=A0A8C9K6P1_PANTA
TMVDPNGSESSATYFILIGLPGLEKAQFWLAFPLCSLYLIAVLGSGMTPSCPSLWPTPTCLFLLCSTLLFME